MKQNNAIPWWGWLALVVSVALGAMASPHLAPLAPRAKALTLLYEPGLMVLVLFLWHVLWRIDPKRKNFESFWSTYRYVGGVIVVFLGLTYLTALGHLLKLVSLRVLPTEIGVMFMLIANVLPRVQPNWAVGFRTPWTLSNPESWTRTHRLGGQLGIPAGLLIIALAWTLPDHAVEFAILVPVLLWVIITVVASYFYARQDPAS